MNHGKKLPAGWNATFQPGLNYWAIRAVLGDYHFAAEHPEAGFDALQTALKGGPVFVLGTVSHGEAP